jgi:hypothetical protein
MKDRIIETLTRIETKLDNVIKAMHDYDDNIYSGYDEPNEALLKAAGLYNEEVNKRYGESSFEAFMDAKMEDNMGDSNTQDKDKRVVGKKGKRKFNGNKNKG